MAAEEQQSSQQAANSAQQLGYNALDTNQVAGSAASVDVATVRVPMPVSPSGVSGISVRRFRNCRSFDKL